MGLSQIKFFVCLYFLACGVFFVSSLTGNEANSKILYLIQAGETTKALQAYQEHCQATGKQDFELIQKIALTVLDQGWRSKDPEIQLLTLFGAGVSANDRALYILEEGLFSQEPELQLVALKFIGKYQNDRSDEILNYLMGSNNLLIRLEAGLILAEKKHPKAVGQIESLMAKVREELLPLFPQFFAIMGDASSIKILRRLLTNRDEEVRIEAILSAAKYERDDLLPSIRRLATHHHAAQQEACAIALGMMKDEASIPKLKELARSHNSSVQLAALYALYQVGQKEVRTYVEKLAKAKDPFAITLLGEMPGSEAVLADLIKDRNIQIRVNAALALLKRHDSRCLNILRDLLIEDSRDLLLLKVSSLGKSLAAWKVVSSASQNFSEIPVAFELSLSLREEILTKALELPEKDFLALANALFEAQQNDLIPILVGLLENLETPEAIELLKKHLQKVGAPLVRNYCNLALYRMKQPGPYAANLTKWVTQKQDEDIIRFRPLVPWEFRDTLLTDSFELTPQETSRLLIEAFESLVNSQDDRGIDLLISLIQKGNPKNKYALVGLLMRATE